MSALSSIGECPLCNKPFHFDRKLSVSSKKLVYEDLRLAWENRKQSDTVIEDVVAIDNMKKLFSYHVLPQASLVNSMLQENIEKDLSKSKTFKCPNCQGLIQICFLIQPVCVIPSSKKAVEDQPVPIKQKTKNTIISKEPVYTPEEMRFLEICKEKGLFQCFVDTLLKVYVKDCYPKFPEKYFIKYLVNLKPVPKISNDSRQFLKNLLGTNKYKLWYYGSIVTLSENDEMTGFIPYRMLTMYNAHSQQIPQIAEGLKSVDTRELVVWTRTKNGYIPKGNRVHMNELNKKNVGLFELTVKQ